MSTIGLILYFLFHFGGTIISRNQNCQQNKFSYTVFYIIMYHLWKRFWILKIIMLFCCCCFVFCLFVVCLFICLFVCLFVFCLFVCFVLFFGLFVSFFGQKNDQNYGFGDKNVWHSYNGKKRRCKPLCRHFHIIFIVLWKMTSSKIRKNYGCRK